MLKQMCPYFGKCGGCVWQDLSQDEYVAKKEMFIRRAFADAGIAEIPLNPIILLPTGIRRMRKSTRNISTGRSRNRFTFPGCRNSIPGRAGRGCSILPAADRNACPCRP